MTLGSVGSAGGRPPLELRRAGSAVFVLVGFAGLCLLAYLAFSGEATRRQARLASHRALRVAELQGTVALLNHRLTAAARLVVLSADDRWAEQFDETAAQLDAAILEAGALATPETRAAFAETAGEAHRDLLAVERRSLVLAANGRLAEARALLDSPELRYLQEVYDSGVEIFGQQLRAVAEAQATDLDARAWIEAACLGVITVLLGWIAIAARGQRRLRAAMRRTEAAARTDVVTDLPNRRRFLEDLDAALQAGRHHGAGHALLLIDLDRFKAVNDAHGHPAGDALLRLVATRLRALLPDERRIARLGGDEFAVLLACPPGADRPPNRPADWPGPEPAAVAGRIVAALAEPFALPGGTTARIGASVGVALTRSTDDAAETLMHRADVALYRAKADGRGRLHVFEQSSDQRARAAALLEGELRDAIAAQAVVPHFQPLVDLGSGRIVGLEMLARWPHPVRGLVPPAEFIPLAEDAGLIGPLTTSLLRQGCVAAARWPDGIKLACNLSPLQLRHRGLVATIAAVLAETGFPPRRLEIEVTESALLGDLALAQALLGELKALGVSLALDDFGTGYSSLRHLRFLPFDKLKIDASFVGAMAEDEESAKIVSAVIGLGRSLGLLTVAEGIETEEVAGLLRGVGCDIGQGWLFGRPLPSHGIDALIGVGAARVVGAVPVA